MRILPLALVLVPTTALAEPAWQVDATITGAEQATRTDRARRGELDAGVGGQLGRADCRWADADVEAGFTADANPSPASVAQSATLQACPTVAPAVATVFLRETIAWDVRVPWLAAPRTDGALARTAGFDFGWLGFDVGPPDGWTEPNHIVVGNADLHMEFDGGGRIGGGLTGALFAYRRARSDGGAPLDVWFFEPTGEFTQGTPDEPSTMLVRLDAVSFSGARLGPARIGGRLGYLGPDVEAPMTMPGPLRSISALDAALDVSADAVGATWKLGAGRDAWAIPDGRMVLDDRATLSVDRVGQWHARGEVFAARSLIMAVDGIRAAATGGATALLERALGDHAAASLRVDAGRGFYAPGATLDAPRWGVEALASLSLRAASR